jgi:hypothetical protein
MARGRRRSFAGRLADEFFTTTTSIATITRKKTEATMSPMIFHVRPDPDDESDEDEEESLFDGEPEVFVSGRLELEPALGFGVSGGISGC